MPAQKRSLPDPLDEGDTSHHNLFHSRHAKHQQQQHQDQSHEHDGDHHHEEEEQEEEEEGEGEEEEDDDDDEEEEDEEVEEAAHDNDGKETPQGYVSFSLFFSFCFFVTTCYFWCPNWFFSTGSRFVSPLRFFMCSSFLLFSFADSDETPSSGSEEKPEYSLFLSHTRSLSRALFRDFCSVFHCLYFLDSRFDSMLLFLDRGSLLICLFCVSSFEFELLCHGM